MTVDNILDTRGSYNLDLSHDIESDEHLNHKVKVSTEAEQAEQRHQELMRKQAERNAEYEKRWRAESARMKAEHEANVKAEEEQRKKQAAAEGKQYVPPPPPQQPKYSPEMQKFLAELGL